MAQQESAEEIFGAQVRQAREARGWTQDRLRRVLQDVAGVDLSSTAMTRLEQGKRPIRLNEVTALAQILELGLERYAGGPVRLMQQDEYERARKELLRLHAMEAEAHRRLDQAREAVMAATASEHHARQQMDQLRTQIARLEASLARYDMGRDGLMEALHRPDPPPRQ